MAPPRLSVYAHQACLRRFRHTDIRASGRYWTLKNTHIEAVQLPKIFRPQDNLILVGAKKVDFSGKIW